MPPSFATVFLLFFGLLLGIIPNSGQQQRSDRATTDSSSMQCAKTVMTLMYNTVVLTGRPTGTCPYCCAINWRKNIRLMLFTNENPTKGERLRFSAGKLRASKYFHDKRKTIVYVHGFLESCMGKASSSIRLKDAYLGKTGENYNVILVDWSILSAGPWYVQASRNARIVAVILARFLRQFHRSGELTLDNVHIIGFSLGAQIAGIAGKLVKDLAPVGRITGLDPAFPMFPIQDENWRLNKGDANFVDIIHTSPVLFGFPISIGDVDFYLNRGMDFQPGCNFEELVLANKLDDYLSCSHQRAWNSYIDSVSNPSAYPAFSCKPLQNRTDGTIGTDGIDGIDGIYGIKEPVYMGIDAYKKKPQGDFCVNTKQQPN